MAAEEVRGRARGEGSSKTNGNGGGGVDVDVKVQLGEVAVQIGCSPGSSSRSTPRVRLALAVLRLSSSPSAPFLFSDAAATSEARHASPVRSRARRRIAGAVVLGAARWHRDGPASSRAAHAMGDLSARGAALGDPRGEGPSCSLHLRVRRSRGSRRGHRRGAAGAAVHVSAPAQLERARIRDWRRPHPCRLDHRKFASDASFS